MFRAAAFAALAFVSVPAAASAQYFAEPVAAPAAERLVVNGTIWKCGDAGCAAGKSNSRPATVCTALARKVGTLKSFSFGGQALSAADLEKCNARAG